jgi:hypothetical protein
MKIKFFILVQLFLIIFNGCSENKKNNYIQEGSSFMFINSQKQCETCIELDKSYEVIETIYSTCNVIPNTIERIEDIEKIIKYFKLENQFKKSNIIKITFLKDGIDFPNQYLSQKNLKKVWNN